MPNSSRNGKTPFGAVTSSMVSKVSNASSKIQKFDFRNYDQNEVEYEQLRIKRTKAPSGNVTPNIIESQKIKKLEEGILKVRVGSHNGSTSKKDLEIRIPEKSPQREEFKAGEENLAPSTEKKNQKGVKVPIGGIKSGTHLGQHSSSKNIFLNKF